MIALSKVLQKVDIKPKIQFIWVKYPLSGSISIFCMEKADITMLLPHWLIMLIWVAKAIDEAVIEVEVLEQWHHPKIYRMSLEVYLGPGNMEFSKREVESLTDILLKTIPHWLVGKNRLKKQ